MDILRTGEGGVFLHITAAIPKRFTYLFMKTFTTGYMHNAHVKLSTEMQYLNGGKEVI